MSESWAEFYQLALIELDSSQMNRRISEARSAILTRLKALPEDATEESQTIADALNSLRLLEREIKSGREEIATMCGRFRQTRSSKILASHFNFELIDALNEFDILPRINIAPTQEVVVIKQDQKKARTITGMRWGLIPVWAKDASVGNRNINARSEGLRETASFRDLIASRRCLIPADGFYEWKKIGKMKQPFCFEMTEGDGLFAFAGLWDSWKNDKGEIIESCTILTTTPNELVGKLHDRMPVIVPADKYEKWLDPEVEDYEAIQDIFMPYDAAKMREYPANPKLNDANNEDISLAGPVEAIEPKQQGII